MSNPLPVGCFVCRKHRGEISVPGGAIYEDDLIYVSHAQLWGDEVDHYLGHLFLEPKRHAPGLADLSEEEAQAIGLFTSRLARALMHTEGVEHVYSFVIGDGVPHVHVHLIGRYPGAPREFWGPKVDEWPEAPRGGEREIEQVAARLRAFMHEGMQDRKGAGIRSVGEPLESPQEQPKQMISVRRFELADWPAVWGFVEPVFRSGDTYAFSTDISETEAHGIWIEAPAATFVAIDEDGAVLGTYYIKANQPGAGSHVCNCGYIVAQHARGRGVATVMCEHSQREAVRRGFRAMQFNFVVSTNEVAVRLWQKLGYYIVGRLPAAFEHPTQGFVDAYVMYKQLVPTQ